MLIVALTGGIGSGKSTVEELFQSHGVPIIDTDIIARELLSNDNVVKLETIKYFGSEITLQNGEIDRPKLRKRIFNEESSRQALQKILHPRIHQQTLHQLNKIKSSGAAYCIIVVPLLAESNHSYPQQRVLLIDSPESLQIERASKRDQSTPELIAKIIASQADRIQRQTIADDIILNDGDIKSLRNKVDKLHKQYCSLAASDQITNS